MANPSIMNTIRAVAFALGSTLLAASAVRADVVETTGGSVILGRVVASEGGVIKVETDFAGVLEIKQDQVKSIATDDPVFVALSDGSTARGRIGASTTGLAVSSTAGTIATPAAGITHIWRDGDKTPADKAADALRAKWVYQLSFDVNGRQGNKSRSFFGLSGSATRTGPSDRLMFYGGFSQAKEESNKSQDDGKFGIDYTNNFSEKVSWYARTEIGYDKIKDLDLRSATAAGLGYNFIKKQNQTLVGRVGLSYRFESYTLTDDFKAAGLDLGLRHTYNFPFGNMVNSVTYTPAFSDFGNYVINHTSTLEMPFAGKQDIRFRVGLTNDYTSVPPPGLKSHDWSYFSSLVFTWK